MKSTSPSRTLSMNVSIPVVHLVVENIVARAYYVAHFHETALAVQTHRFAILVATNVENNIPETEQINCKGILFGPNRIRTT